MTSCSCMKPVTRCLYPQTPSRGRQFFLEEVESTGEKPGVALTPSHRPRNLLPMGQVLVPGHGKSCCLNPHWGKHKRRAQGQLRRGLCVAAVRRACVG